MTTALAGTETLQVQALDGAGRPAAGTEVINTQDLANLVTAKRGTVTLTGAVGVVVANTSVLTSSVIALSFKTLGGTQGAQPVVTAISAGVSFTVAGTALDTSIYNYAIL